MSRFKRRTRGRNYKRGFKKRGGYKRKTSRLKKYGSARGGVRL